MGIGYLHHKAQRYVRLGPDTYRRTDALRKPDNNLPLRALNTIRSGMEQLAVRRGFRLDDPLVGLGVPGIYQLMTTLHHRAYDRITHCGEDNAGGYWIDELRFEHVVCGSLVTVFNRVPACPPTPQQAALCAPPFSEPAIHD